MAKVSHFNLRGGLLPTGVFHLRVMTGYFCHQPTPEVYIRCLGLRANSSDLARSSEVFRSIAARHIAYSLAVSLLNGREHVMQMRIEPQQEEDGRWLGEIPALPGVLAYGQTWSEAIENTQVLALRVIAARIEHGEALSAATRRRR